MLVRKCFVDLTAAERDDFLAALLQLKHKPAPGSTARNTFSVYDQFVAIHTASVSVRSVLNGNQEFNLAHRHPGFLPWHRQFLLFLQRELLAVSATAVIPYWDWTAKRATSDYLFSDDFLGANSSSGSPTPVTTGYFSKSAPANPPSWWPTGLKGWTLPTDLQLPWESWAGELHRNIRSENELPDETVLTVLHGMSTYQNFWHGLEDGFGLPGGSPPFGPTHDFMHGWVGGHMGQPLISPFDPVFSLNHAFVDYLWDRWQRDGHAGDAYYPKTDDWDGQAAPGTIPRGHLLNDAMYPWVGSDSGDYVTTITRVGKFLPNFSGQAVRRPADVLYTTDLPLDRDLEYSYQEPLPRFARVKRILDAAIDGWANVNGRRPDLVVRHRDGAFGWSDRDQLLEAEARGLRLVAPDLIGQSRSEETNLIRILRGRLNQFPQMPLNGPFLEEDDIDYIARWIDHGCLDDAEPPPNGIPVA